jgi:hypothetical protein
VTQEFKKPTNLIKFLSMAGMKKSNTKVVVCNTKIEVKIINLMKKSKKPIKRNLLYIMQKTELFQIY